MEKLNVYLIKSTDPYKNLSFEYNLLKSSDDVPKVIFWQSEKSVILGNFQNVWSNVDLKFLKDHQINLVRRYSGGGCVYQDLGNLNFSFIFPSSTWDLDFYKKILFDVIAKYCPQIMFDEHHSLYVEDKKISGAAFRFTKEKKIYHGTLLIKSNLELLKKLLSPVLIVNDKSAVKSKRREVINLSSYTDCEVSDVIESLMNELSKYFHLEVCKDIYTNDVVDNHLKNRQYILYKTPSCIITLREAEDVEYRFYIEKGIVKNFEIDHTLFHPDFEKILKSQFTGRVVDQLDHDLLKLKEKYVMYKDELENLYQQVNDHLLWKEI